MGSLRNPVGPLPSSIYWRRRAVVLSVVALLVLLVVWAVTSSGGGGKNKADGSNGKHPTSSITPGPSGTGPAISQRPGGRDESGGGDGSGSSGSSGSGASGGTGGAGSGGAGDGVNVGGSGGTSSSADQLPAGGGATLPNCASGAVQLTLRSLHNTYEPGDTPTFQLIAKNTSGGDCKVDLGPKYAVLTITQAGGGSAFWTSADCPGGSGGALFRVPANEQVAYTVKWDRKHSAPNCATPPAGSAPAGTYLVEAKVPGFPKAQTSFVLAKD